MNSSPTLCELSTYHMPVCSRSWGDSSESKRPRPSPGGTDIKVCVHARKTRVQTDGKHANVLSGVDVCCRDAGRPGGAKALG